MQYPNPLPRRRAVLAAALGAVTLGAALGATLVGGAPRSGAAPDVALHVRGNTLVNSSGSPVRLIGADRHRYVVTANGHPIPLLATSNSDVQVGGVRYRAWQPPSALHPTITVDTPLRFELIDTATGTSRGGCTYHVSHPGGRSYDNPPVNAVEAESRRGRRLPPARNWRSSKP